MTILLDESVPRLNKTQLSEFPITTVQERGWSGMKNGELLAEAEQQFTILITADQKLRYQQNLTGRLSSCSSIIKVMEVSFWKELNTIIL